MFARVRAEAKDDHVSLLAAGVAFFGLLALVPGLVAMISIYGLVAEPDDIERQVVDALDAAPAEVRDVVSEQLQSITDNSGGAILALVLSIVLALWSASSGMSHLIEAINLAYDEHDDRGFVRKRGLAVGLTVGAIVFMLVALTLIAVVPAALGASELGVAGRVAANIARWVLLAVAIVVALAVLYRLAPDRDDADWRWISPGAIFAAVAWLVASALFSVYTANFGKYNETYGTLGAIVVVMLWLLISAAAIILGAELNCELERQTVHDTTTGRNEPLGERGAYAADTIGGPA